MHNAQTLLRRSSGHTQDTYPRISHNASSSRALVACLLSRKPARLKVGDHTRQTRTGYSSLSCCVQCKLILTELVRCMRVVFMCTKEFIHRKHLTSHKASSSSTPFVCLLSCEPVLQFGEQTTQAHAGDTCAATAIAKIAEVLANKGGLNGGGGWGTRPPPPPPLCHGAWGPRERKRERKRAKERERERERAPTTLGFPKNTPRHTPLMDPIPNLFIPPPPDRKKLQKRALKP